MFGKEKMILPVNRLIGEVTLPGDKSISHRALMLAALAEGESVISNLSSSRDVYHTRMCLEELGVVIKDEGDHVRVFGAGLHGLKPPSRVLDAGNSGTTMRLLAGILAGQSFNSVLDGDESLRKRPMGRIITPLSRMGANITASEQNTAPLSIQGQPLQGIEYRSPIASAQVKSAILLAGLYASGETTVIEPAPSRNHTELMFEYLGIPIEREGLKTTLHPAPFKARDITIPGDFSAAAFFIVAALMVPNSYIIIRNVNLNSTRAFMLQLLKQAGAHIHVISESIRFQEKWGDLIIESSDIQPFEISGEMVPQLIDEIPILAILATQARGTTLIRDAHELRVKESDRLMALYYNLKRMGARVSLYQDGLEIIGPTILQGTEIDTYGDHRIAMAFSVAGLISEGETVIPDPEVVEISFPNFFQTLESIILPNHSYEIRYSL